MFLFVLGLFKCGLAHFPSFLHVNTALGTFFSASRNPPGLLNEIAIKEAQYDRTTTARFRVGGCLANLKGRVHSAVSLQKKATYLPA